MCLPFGQNDLHGVLVVNQGNTLTAKPDCVAIVLDFDLYVTIRP